MSISKTLLKIIMVGDSQTGKTMIMNGYVNKKFSNDYKSTIGADFLRKEVVIDGKLVTLQIWDTAGDEKLRTMNAGFYRGADAFVYVYDVTKHQSFESIPKWLEDLTDDHDIPRFLVGNKIDLENQRSVTRDEAQELTESQFIAHVEVSAKASVNISTLFETVARQVLKKVADDEELFSSLSQHDEKNERKGFFQRRPGRFLQEEESHALLQSKERTSPFSCRSRKKKAVHAHNDLEKLILKLEAKRDKLENQINSRWVYPNLERKGIKRAALNKLINDLKENVSLSIALENVKAKYPNVMKNDGLRHQTQNLIKEAEALAEKQAVTNNF